MDMKRILQAMDGVATKPVVGADDMARFLRVVKEAELNQIEAVGQFSADPKQQAKMYLQYHTGMMDPSTLPKFMNVSPGVSLAVQPPPTGSSGSHEEVLAYLSAANKRLPKELQVGWDELKNIGGVSGTINLTGEPHPDKYNPATDPTDTNPIATPLKINEAANPHKVALPVQMAMQHYSAPKQTATQLKTESLLKGYLQELDEEAIAEQAHKRQLINQYAQTIADRVMMKESHIDESPIDMTGDPNDPTIYGHEKANPMSLKGRIMSARAQLKELAQLADSDSLVAWEEICAKAQGGMFMGLEQNIEQIRHGISELAAKRRKGGRGSIGINRYIGEDNDPCWKDYKQIGTKKKGGKTVPNCVPKNKRISRNTK